MRESPCFYVCNNHIERLIETMVSPCRGTCKICKQKRVNGFSNPDHVSNPFGYLYLIPDLCESCAVKHKKCMWCKY